MGITGSPSAQMSIRAAVVSDLHRVVALLASHADETGDDRVSATELRSWWTAPEFDLGWQVLVAEAAGELVGYADIGDPNGDRTQLWIDLRVPASGRTLRADAHLLDGALDRARQHAAAGVLLRPNAAESPTWAGSASWVSDGHGGAEVSAVRCSFTRSTSCVGVASRATGAVALYEGVGMTVTRRSVTLERHA